MGSVIGDLTCVVWPSDCQLQRGNANRHHAFRAACKPVGATIQPAAVHVFGARDFYDAVPTHYEPVPQNVSEEIQKKYA